MSWDAEKSDSRMGAALTPERLRSRESLRRWNGKEGGEGEVP